MQLYSIYDAAAGSYSPPFAVGSKGLALRLFSDWCNDPARPFKAHAQDYSLWFIGLMQDETGVVEGVQPERIVTAIDVLELGS